MRLLMLLAVWGLVVPLGLLADEPKKDAVVKELDLKGLKLERPKGSVEKPMVITNEDELRRFIPEEEVRGVQE